MAVCGLLRQLGPTLRGSRCCSFAPATWVAYHPSPEWALAVEVGQSAASPGMSIGFSSNKRATMAESR